MSTDLKTQTDTCSECTYWKPLSATDGECRRQPPQAISFKVNDELRYETKFPVTSEADWCGEFSAK